MAETKQISIYALKDNMNRCNEEWLKPYLERFKKSPISNFDFYLFTHIKKNDLEIFSKWYKSTFFEADLFEKNLMFCSKGDYGDELATLYTNYLTNIKYVEKKKHDFKTADILSLCENESWAKKYIQGYKDYCQSCPIKFQLYLFTSINNQHDVICLHEWFLNTFMDSEEFIKNLIFFALGEHGEKVAKLYRNYLQILGFDPKKEMDKLWYSDRLTQEN
jgi:hypothetical protein